MTVQVLPGEGHLLLIYEDTPPRTAGGVISLATAVLLAAMVLWSWWRGQQKRILHGNFRFRAFSPSGNQPG